MSTIKEQRMNTFLALGVLAGVIAVVCVIGILTFHKETEYVQGQAEVTEYRVSSKVPGRILEFKVQEGQKVHKGDTLAILEAPEVEAKKAQAEAVEQQALALSAKAQAGARSAQKYDEVKAQRDAAIATEKAARSQYRLALDGAQEEDKEMAAAKVLQAQGAVAEVNSYIHETFLTAYADGEVTEIFPHLGELVGTGAPIMNIAQMDDQWASFNVREDYLKDFYIGSEFDAYVPAIDRTVRMKVSYMKDIGDFAAWKATKETGQYDLKTFEVRATPLSATGDLRPGMSVIVKKEHRR